MTVLAQDSFDRADGALGTADVGGAWTAIAGTDSWGIVSNTARTTGVSVGIGITKIGSPVADVKLSVDYTDNSPGRGYTGLFARYVDDGNYYVCHAQNGSSPRHANIYAVVAYARTNILNFDMNDATYKLGFQLVGSTLSILKNDVEVASIVDTTYTAAGPYGMMFWTTSGWSDGSVDNFLATDIPAPPPAARRSSVVVLRRRRL